MNWRSVAYRHAARVRGDRVFELLDELRASERWPPARIREVQEARLRALLLHAFEHVPYYREPLPASRVVVDGPRLRVDLVHFTDLPTLTRHTVMDRTVDLRDSRPAEFRNPRFWVASAGTTGTPIRVMRDHVARQHALAAELWFGEWTGVRFGERKVAVWGPLRSTLGPWQRVRYAARTYLKNEVRLQHYVLSDEMLDRYISRINRVRPAQVLGWPNVLAEVARRAEQAGRRLLPPSIRDDVGRNPVAGPARADRARLPGPRFRPLWRVGGPGDRVRVRATRRTPRREPELSCRDSPG